MSQQPQMNMAGMGGPVGGPQMNAGTPSNAVDYNMTQIGTVKRLNTAIYDYLLRNQMFDVAKSFRSQVEIETKPEGKQSPGQRGQQANGVDDSMDLDGKESTILNKPNDLPFPRIEADFLKDWWCQFWEIWRGHRNKGTPPITQNYINAQRQAMNQRMGMMPQNGAQGMRAYNGMMPGMNNGQVIPNDLKRAAMQNRQGITPQQQQQMMKNMQANQQNGQMMQGNQMERSGSQMENRPGTPGSGDAPSPKRQRIEGGMQAMNQGRPGQPGQMQGNQVGAAEVYANSLLQQQKRQMTQPNSDMNKGIPPNMGPGGAQGSPMSQPGMDGATGEFYAAANGNNRMAMQPNAANAAAAGQAGNSNGNHALQDYQMQLMLLEQQNKKRLLMARQEQDSMSGQHPGGVGPNGAFAAQGMSPQGSQRGGDPSPNPNDMQRGMMDPNIPPQVRAQMMAQNGMIRPPSSHPMNAQQAEMMRQQGIQMPNGQFPGGQPPQGMPGQAAPGQPGQPMGTPRQNNMPPPPAPQANAGGTQPSSPSQPPAPPTPSQTNKPKPGTKKETAKKGAAQKKGGANATPATESEAPPTPTPATPITPMNASSFNKNQNLPNGQAAPAGQANQQGQQGSQAPPAAQPAAPSNASEMPFGALDGNDQSFGMPLEFGNLDSGDVLDNFDFDSFLNQDSEMNFAFDGSLGFDGIEAGGLDGTNG